MKLSRIEEQIKMLIAEITSFSQDEILVEDKLIDLGIDPSKIDIVVVNTQELFGISLDKSELSTSMTVHDFIELIDSNVKL